jgi:hypothetical protein
MTGVIVSEQWEPIDIVKPIVIHILIAIVIHIVPLSLLLFLLSLLFLLLLFLDHAFTGLDTPLPLLSEVRSSRPQENWNCPQGSSSPTGLLPVTAPPGNTTMYCPHA